MLRSHIAEWQGISRCSMLHGGKKLPCAGSGRQAFWPRPLGPWSGRGSQERALHEPVACAHPLHVLLAYAAGAGAASALPQPTNFMPMPRQPPLSKVPHGENPTQCLSSHKALPRMTCSNCVYVMELPLGIAACAFL